MSRTVVCYLQRVAGGSLLERVRLIADTGGGAGSIVDRTWTAPSLPISSSPAPAADNPDAAPLAGAGDAPAVTQTRAAARWVADTLNTLGTRRLACVCVDPDGAVCTWLSAPSPDAKMIEATLMQPDTENDPTGAGGGGGAARLLALSAGASSGFSPGDASVQALATLERPSGGVIPGKGKSSGVEGERKRFAVLAVPDAPVRVFLDELDVRGVEVDEVVSLWHALATAWDPSSPGSDEAIDSSAGERVVANVSPAAAVVAVDPTGGGGRLVWSWSQGGQLVAAGAMRLRSITLARPETEDSGEAEGGATRIKPMEPVPTSIEFTQADAGRLALDWLSWSAQLGHCPQRVACIGPAAATANGDGPHVDPGLIGRSIGEVWPGATVGVAVHDDPMGATLQRLLTRDIAQANRRAAELEVATGSDDPRAALVGLSARPGRIDRRMTTWMAIGVAAIAVVVGAVGFQLHRAVGKAQSSEETAISARKEAIDSLKESMPQLVASSNFKLDLEAEATRLETQNSSIKPPRPLLEEFESLMLVIAEHKDVKVESFMLNQNIGTVKLRVPDGETGPAILEKIRKLPNLYMNWDGTVATQFGTASATDRRYQLNGLQADPSRGGGK